MSSALIVDALPLVYSAYHQLGHLATQDGEPTGLRYGFIRAIRSYTKKFDTQNVIIAWDTDDPVTKATNSPEYKANRTRTPAKEEMYSQVPALKELLSLTKWTQIEAPGYEADDIIGHVARTLEKQGHQIVIVSSDNDFCQLVSENVTIYVPGKIPTIKDRAYVKTLFGVEPEKVLYLRAAFGDSSDNLKGLGWTSKTREEFIHFLNKLPSTVTRGEVQAFPNLRDSNEARVAWQINTEIMSLQKPTNLNIRKGKRDSAALEKLFLKLEMKTLLKLVSELTGTNDNP